MFSMADDCGYSSQKTPLHHIHICMFFHNLLLKKVHGNKSTKQIHKDEGSVRLEDA